MCLSGCVNVICLSFYRIDAIQMHLNSFVAHHGVSKSFEDHLELHLKRLSCGSPVQGERLFGVADRECHPDRCLLADLNLDCLVFIRYNSV